MKILGIDPGFDRCGVAVVERVGNNKEKVVDSGCITTSSSDPFEERLLKVVGGVKDWISIHNPGICALERLYFTKNQKTAMRVAETRGAILAAVAGCGVAVQEFGPGEIKVAVTGNGRASKDQVVRMVSLILDMHKDGALDDEYDAIAVALTALAVHRT